MGWDNINGLDDSLLQLANEVKMWGEKWDVGAFTTSDLMLSKVITGHNMAILACGLSQYNYCYYRGPHDGGTVMLAFSGVPEEVFQPLDMKKFVSVIVHCLDQFLMDHKIFIEAFLHWNQTLYKWEGQTIEAEFEQKLIIDFEAVDDSLQISELKMVAR